MATCVVTIVDRAFFNRKATAVYTFTEGGKDYIVTFPHQNVDPSDRPLAEIRADLRARAKAEFIARLAEEAGANDMVDGWETTLTADITADLGV